MKTLPFAIAHTYYLPHYKRVIGDAADELGDVLRLVWLAAFDHEPAGRLDGVSAWLDREGGVWMAIVRDRAVCFVLDVAILRAARAALERSAVYAPHSESAHG